MNSLQLVSKIRSKAEDLSHNITELLNASHAFNGMDRELLKKQCLDLYELLLKLKTDSELNEEKIISKPIVQAPPVVVPPPAPPVVEETPVMEVNEPAAEPTAEIKEEAPLFTGNFQDVIQWADTTLESLDVLVNKVQGETEPEHEEIHKPEEIIPEIEHELKQEKLMAEIPGFGEINIGKAVENKRIQYTVMPDVEIAKPAITLNENFSEKELSFNEKVATVQPPVMIPMAEKTIEAPIDNIKSAINLNKKIAFVNELFRENVVEYAKAIDRLNNAADRNDAFRIHNELKHQYHWDNANELVMELERLIKRRF